MTREDAIREMMFAKRNVIADSFIDKAYDMAIKALKATQWIPCSERLPEYANFYLTTTEYNSVYCDFYDGYRFQRIEKVIAWMPLPEPYKEEEQ